MPKRAAGLTTRQVQTKPRGFFADGGGLYLQVAPSGARTWVFRYQIAGRRRDMGLGSVATFTLAEARQRATEARKLVADGIDPIEQRRASRQSARLDEAKAMTFRECAERYVAAHRVAWRNAKHAAQWPSSLETYVYPAFGGLAVAAVDTALVTKALEPIWTVKPETASRVRGRVESVLDWAAARGYRKGENPARWRGHLENLLPKTSKVRRVAHHAALPYPEIAAFVAELREQPGVAARALEFLILTAGRAGEVLGARWGEISETGALWAVSRERMKAGREHRVPLSGAALAILDQMAAIRQSDFVFPGSREGRSLSDRAFLSMLRRMGRRDLTTHGFRSTFRDWCAEQTSFPSEVAEMALAHIVADRVEAAYRRGDLFEKRRDLAEAWARFCESGESPNVVPIIGRP